MTTPFDKAGLLYKELEGASDRAAAIVAGAFLDEVLQELLCTFMIEGTEGVRKLFEGNGPLATFSSKIEMSYRLGLISEGEHRTLNTVRAIRNDFAHVLGEISFESQSVRARCRNIEPPLSMVAPRTVPLSQKGEVPPLPIIEKASSENPRAVFQEAVTTLMHCLAGRTASAGIVKRRAPADFAAAYEPGEMVLGRLKALLSRYEELLEHERCPQEDREEFSRQRKNYELLVRIQEFCCQQIRRVHEESSG